MPKTFVEYVVIALIALLVVFAVASPFIIDLATKRTVTITVQARDDVPKGKADHLMLIQDTNNNWYRVGDSIVNGKFRSRDTWGSMKQGGTYECVIVSWRIGWPLSWYPNIIDAKTK